MIHQHEINSIPNQLLSAEGLYPYQFNWHLDWQSFSAHDAPKQCNILMLHKLFVQHPNIQTKYNLWTCLLQIPLAEWPQDFWLAPIIHPDGGSWAYHTFLKKSEEFGKLQEKEQENLVQHAHATERFLMKTPDKVTHLEQFFSELTIDNLYNFSLGHSVLRTEKHVVFIQNDERDEFWFELYDPQDWMHFTITKPFLGAFNPRNTCDYLFLGFCWKRNQAFYDEMTSRGSLSLILPVILVIFNFAAVLGIYAFSLKHIYQNQKIMIETLTHEIRHPVAVIKLILEHMRTSYHNLNTEMQIEFGKLFDQSRKLQRLIEASIQYLNMNTISEREFQFQYRKIQPLQDLFERITDPYLDLITYQYEVQLDEIEGDLYWMEVCCTNLIRNAVDHGRPPITVRIHEDEDFLIFTVQDKGTQLNSIKNLSEILKKSDSHKRSLESKGLGLGLKIIKQMMFSMKGKLTFDANPTRFSLYFPKKRVKR